ncbi:MAG: tetratricopeptide repeat protein [Planctomycetia bacterium]|nr:tetratricopeptide repeat protein [Planctomycetia bacterium]
MRSLIGTLLVLVTAFANSAKAQTPAPAAAAPTPPPAAVEDPRIRQMEGSLSKLRDTSPEAAALMVELIDAYYAEGRVFGIIRVGQTFVTGFSSHPKHKDVMLKLIDGLLATSRNKEIITLARQFLQRYPEDPACPRIEQVLATTLEQVDDRPRAAEALDAVWRRLGDTFVGREAALRAFGYYNGMNNKDGFTKAAILAESVADKVAAPEFATRFGLDAVINWQRIADYAKSNAVGSKLLKKNLPADPAIRAYMHTLLAQNDISLGQRANAAENYRKARTLVDNRESLSRLIVELASASAPPEQMQPLIDEYINKYPFATDRFVLKSYLPAAYIRVKNYTRAVQLLKELLLEDPSSNSVAALFVQYNTHDWVKNVTDAPKYPETEQLLLQAIGKNPINDPYLRYVLAFTVYRDLIKDPTKTKQILRDMLAKSPSSNHYSNEALVWLLNNAENDQAFTAELQLALKSREENLNLSLYRTFLPTWAQQNRNNKDLKARAAQVKDAIDKADQTPLALAWVASESPTVRTAQEGRAKLLAAGEFEKLNDAQARQVVVQQAESYRYQAAAEMRMKGIELYGKAAKRFPTDYLIAVAYLEVASDYGTPEVGKEAALALLKLEPTGNNSDTWRRLFIVADKNKDAALVKASFDWITKAQLKFGPEMGNASVIADVMDRNGMPTEAMALLKKCLDTAPNTYEARNCVERMYLKLPPTEVAARIAVLRDVLTRKSDYHGQYAGWLAMELYKTNDIAGFEQVLRDSRALQNDRANRPWGLDDSVPQQFLEMVRTDKDADLAKKQRVAAVVRDMQLTTSQASARLLLLELAPQDAMKPMDRLLAYQAATSIAGNASHEWDYLMTYAQAAMIRKDYPAAATLVTGMMANMSSVEVTRRQTGRDLVGQSYARMGAAGLSIDESSPIAPLLQAALYLRLGDDRLAFESYSANKALFDENRAQMPIDLILFVCESHIAAGGDANHDRAEDILRGWLIKNGESKDIDDPTKASVQLLLAKNFFKSQRYDVARSEFSTVVNRWPSTPQAIEAQFGIGESYMAQKVYDQAELVFEKLVNSKERDVVIRAEFLRGVLANRRGDRDEARDIFKAVLDRVPSVELANQALFNLAEVYGAEERYIDQLELLRTVGRLGRTSQRWHAPGTALAIVVQDSDLGISRGHARIPVRVTTIPGGDEETIFLYSGGAGKGLFRADLETRLGTVAKNDKVLQLSGLDVIKCDYPAEFKAEFKSVPLSDAEIHIAADARFEVAGSKIIDEREESFSEKLEREARERDRSRGSTAADRPKNQIKPGNPVYMRVQDADRDLTEKPDSITVKLVATSGDQVQAKLMETGPHTGIFEATAMTGDLPAGAVASDTSIEHSPLMAIDKDPATFWLSEPDGATPKMLSIDMKDLKIVDHVTISSPKPDQQFAVRGDIEVSNDGRFWFRIASQPPQAPAPKVAESYGKMTRSVFEGNYTNLTTWEQIVALMKNQKPTEQTTVNDISYTAPNTSEGDAIRQRPHAAVWHGKLVQQRDGAARIAIQGNRTAFSIDGRLELLPGDGNRFVDVWLEKGTHDLTIFAATNNNAPLAGATIAREDHSALRLDMLPFTAADFDLARLEAQPAQLRAPATLEIKEGRWEAKFAPIAARHVRFMIREYLGEAVAVNNFIIGDSQVKAQHIPTAADVLSLAVNDVLEIAAGDKVTASYADEMTQAGTGRSQLLSASLTATYYNAETTSIAYDFERQSNGAMQEIRKELVRIDPGQRVVVEITDYDLDITAGLDQLKFQVSVNDGTPLELVAQEIEQRPGVFTKEVDTSATPAEGKLTVKVGDRVVCSYTDLQNTFPGHAVPREATVYIAEPSAAKIRIVETRVIRPPVGSAAPPRITYLPMTDVPVSTVAFEAPLTIEVIDPDAARDSRSKTLVKLTTPAGAAIEVECVVARDPSTTLGGFSRKTIEEGRFIGQVILQLGGKDSPDIVPLVAGMPRNLLGGGKLAEADQAAGEEIVVTRVLNVSGKDIIDAQYKDELKPEAAAALINAKGRLIANATLACVDRDYERDVTQLHVGEKLFLKIVDADLDTSDQRDHARVVLTTARGDREEVELEETLTHSGVFTGSVLLKAQEKATPGNSSPVEAQLEAYFGDLVMVEYVDKAASTESGELALKIELPVVVGTDGLVAAFSKTFGDETLAVETQFHVAESYFELFKSHQKLERKGEQRTDLEAGRRVLREVMEDYPNPKYIARIAYLLGQFAQELKDFDEAIDNYQLIVKQYPDSTLAPDAQYKLAQCYEEQGDFDQALEAYVTLAATYPKSALIANVMIRISDYFYKGENFEVAAQVGEKFLERFDGHEWGPQMAFRIGQCYYKGKDFTRAGKAFDNFTKVFPDHALCSDAWFWAGESWRMGNSIPEAFRRYNWCRWKFAESEAAKYARGRLALPEMLQQFEAEANSVDP